MVAKVEHYGYSQKLLHGSTLSHKLEHLIEIHTQELYCESNFEMMLKREERLNHLTKMLEVCNTLEEFKSPDPRTNIEYMHNSILITEDRVYSGQTNKDGQPDGKGFLIDLNYAACFEGCFRREIGSPGRLRIINSDGESEWTDEMIDFEQNSFDFNRYRALAQKESELRKLK